MYSYLRDSHNGLSIGHVRRLTSPWWSQYTLNYTLVMKKVTQYTDQSCKRITLTDMTCT